MNDISPAEKPQHSNRATGSAVRRAWRLVRGERRGPISRFFGRRIPLKVGARRRQVRLGTLVSLAVVVVLALGSVVVFATPLLGARSVEVVGTKQLSAAQVRAAANVTEGAPLARINTGEIEARVRSIASVAQASVVRAWPATIRIKVKERRPAVAMQRGSEYVVIDALGVPYSTSKSRPADLPLIKVADPDAIVVPDFTKNPLPKNKTLLAAARTALTLTPELRAKLVRLDAPDPYRISVELTGGRSFFWGAADDLAENLRKATVATILLNRPGHIIDVSTPGVVSVR